MSEINTFGESLLTPDWQDWIFENLRRGCSPQSMISMMVQAGFDAAVAESGIHLAAQSLRSPLLSGVVSKPAIAANEGYRYEGSRIVPGNKIVLNDVTVNVALRLERPDVVLFTGFMSNEECDELVEHASKKLLPSTIVDPQSGETRVIGHRSSEGTYFQRGENELVQKLERRISELMNWPIERGEGIQVLNYKVGAEYKAHFDYFPPEDPGSHVHMVQGGQRVSTLVMYLNDVSAGGETVFPTVGLGIVPQRGSAAYFSYGNSLGQVDPATLHAGAPVREGEKWIATKWMRQRQYGG